MIAGKTKSGFKFQIDQRALEDWSLINLATKYDACGSNLEKAAIVPEIANLLIGKGGFDKLEKHIRSKNDGYCTISDLQTEIFEIMQTKEIKN